MIVRRHPDFRHRSHFEEVQTHYSAAWFGHCKGANGPDTANRTHFSIVVSSRFDPRRFSEALLRLAERHTILSARVEARGDQVWLRRGASLEIPLEICDISMLPYSGRFEAAIALLTERVWQKFDLSGQLSRAIVVDMGGRGFVFAVVVHHFLCELLPVRLTPAEANPAFASKSTGLI